MKLKYSSLILVALVGLLASCKKFVERDPYSSYNEEEYYKTTEQVLTGVYGSYAALRNVYNIDYVLAGLRSDDSYISDSEGDINQVDGFTERTTNSYVAAYWQQSYFTIKQCNTVLKYLNNVTDPVQKDYFEAEVKFIRAHMYFNMVRLFGDVPLVMKSVEYNDTASYRRVNKTIVYDSIIADLNVAVAKLPQKWDESLAGRVTTNAAKGMLAKVYLTLQKYPESKAILSTMINAGTGAVNYLLPNYKSIWGIGNEMNPEIIYAVRYKAATNGMGNTFTYNFDRVSGSVGFRSASDLRGSAMFPTADSIRKNQTFNTVTSSTGSISYYNAGKYLDPGSPRNDGGADFVVLRYADIILMYAEVENEINGATALKATDSLDVTSRLYQLNLIRKRANPNTATALRYTYTNTNVTTQTAFRTAVRNERRRELAIENQRWYDLLRYGTAVEAMNTHFQSRASASFVPPVVQAYQTLYPIPQREIDVSGRILSQNPGY